MDDILDDFSATTVAHPKTMIWWERRRLRYNFILGAFGVGMMLWLPRLWPTNAYHAFEILLLGALANIAFTAGWVSELLLYYYTGRKWNLSTLRPGLFWLGTIVSLVWVFINGMAVRGF